MKIIQLKQIKSCEGKQGKGCWDIRSPMTRNEEENKPAPLPPAASPETGPLLAVPPQRKAAADADRIPFLGHCVVAKQHSFNLQDFLCKNG